MRRKHAQECGVPGCTRPVESVTICAECLADHDERLDHLPLIAQALEDRFLKLQRFSVASLGIGDPNESPVPFDKNASRARRMLLRALVRWTHAFDITDPFGYPSALGYKATPPTVPALVEHLHRHRDIIAVSVLGPQAVDDIRRAYEHGLRAVDRPPDLVFLGICSWTYERDGEQVECDEDLYAEWGRPLARCRKCKHEHDVKNRQAVLLSHVNDQLASASDISRGLSGLDISVTAERIRKWKERGRIASRGNNLRGDPIYRVGDVVDRVLAERQRIADDLRNTQPRKAEPA